MQTIANKSKGCSGDHTFEIIFRDRLRALITNLLMIVRVLEDLVDLPGELVVVQDFNKFLQLIIVV